MKITEKHTDILIIGGGAAGCYAAITLAEEYPGLSVILAEKANIKRSGCLAAGVNALNAYITPGHTPLDYVNYAKHDAAGIVREDLLLSMAEGLNRVTAKLEKLGLVILKNPDGSYAARGARNIKINGENIKPLLAAAVNRAENVEVINHVNIVDYLLDDKTVNGAWGIDTNEERVYVFSASAVICATGGAAGLYRPNHAGASFAKHCAAAPVEPATIDNIVSKVRRFLADDNATPYDTDAVEEAMQQTMDEYAGGIKTGYRYTEAQLKLAEEHIKRLEGLSDLLRARDFYGLMKIFELKEQLLVCRAVIAHLAARKETRWHAFAENLDYPEKSAAYEKYVNSKIEDGELKIIFRPLVKTKGNEL